MFRLVGILVALVFMTSSATAVEGLRLIVPGAPGDGSAQVMRAVGDQLVGSGRVGEVRYDHRPRSAAILSDFILNAASIGDTLLAQSASDLFRSFSDDAGSTWRRTTPVATVATDYVALAVSTETPVRTVSVLLGTIRANPRVYAVIGASPRRGLDQAILSWILKEAGLDYGSIRYLPSRSIEDALDRLASGQASVVVGSLSRMLEAERSGKLRVLATTAPEPLASVSAPPLVSAGLDIVFLDWSGFFAPPRTNAERLARHQEMLIETARSPEWRLKVAEGGRSPFTLTGQELAMLIDRQESRLRGLIKEMSR